jgi:DEAD/DEAH box helicase domain-containing protein
VLLGAQYGLSVPLEADYVLWPVETSPGQRPVVIFIENFFNHKDKVADDTLKREAIRRSNSFRVWSLSWKDLQDVFEDQGDYATTTLVPENRSFGAQLYRKAADKKNVQILHPDKVGIFELLVQYLENKDAEELFTAHAKAFAFALLDPKKINNRLYFTEWKYLIEPIIENLELREAHFELSNTMFDIWTPRSSGAHLTILAGAALTEIQKYQRHAEVTVCALLNDVLEERTDNYEAEWNGFWHFFNMMQFLLNFAAVSVNGMEQMIYNKIPAAV